MARVKINFRIIFGLLTVFACITGIWIAGFFSFIEQIPKEVVNIEKKTNAIVILTGGRERVSSGISLLSDGKADKMFISGVGKGASLLNMLILSGKLPDNISQLINSIEIGYDAENTNGNAQEAAEWMEKNNFKSMRLVTSNYHTPRSILEFKSKMPNIEIIPDPVVSPNIKLEGWMENKGTKILLFKEYNKYIATKILTMLGA